MTRRIGVVLALSLAGAVALDPFVAGTPLTVEVYRELGAVREALVGAKFLGSGFGALLVALVVGALDRWQRALVIVLVAAVVGLGAAVVKRATGRPRPEVVDPAPPARMPVFHGPGAGLSQAEGQSFPSGHTAGAFATATCLASFYPGTARVAYVIAGATGVQRVARRHHHLSDVVAGAWLGHLAAAWLLARPRVARLWHRPGVDSDRPSP